jgi:hypothetical protein
MKVEVIFLDHIGRYHVNDVVELEDGPFLRAVLKGGKADVLNPPDWEPNVTVIPATVIEEPIVEEPVVEEPVVEELLAQEPVIEEPIIEEPLNYEPLVPIRKSRKKYFEDTEKEVSE